MSNLIKSGFVAFTENKTLIINGNQNVNVIRSQQEKEELAANDLDDLKFEDIVNESEEKSQAEPVVNNGIDNAQVYGDLLLERVNRDCEKLLEEARKTANNILAEAKVKGYETGYAEGEKKAQEAYAEKEKKLYDQQVEFEKRLLAEQEEWSARQEPKLIELVCKLVERLTGVVVEDEQSVLLYILNRAMRDIENSKKLIIKVSNEEIDLLNSKKELIYGASNPSVEIDLFGDAKLQKGQCIIETDNGMIDCSIDEQLKNLIRSLKLLSRT